MNRFEKITIYQFSKDMMKDIDIPTLEIDEFDEMAINIGNIYNEIKMPKRATKFSSGYDIYSPISFVLEPGQTIKVPTGLKIKLDNNKFLAIVVRSSMGFKYNVRLLNQFGNIDSDYYNNSDNEGHMWIGLKNEGAEEWVINQGDAIAQSMILGYHIVVDDNADTKRIGGIGSSNESDK